MARTTPSLVAEVLAYNYDNLRQPSLVPYIDTASALVDRLLVEVSVKGESMPDATAELIERWLAGYYYCMMDPLYQSKSTKGASGQHVTEAGLDGEANRYKRAAITLDYTGCLNALLNRKSARGTLLRQDDPYNTTGNNP